MDERDEVSEIYRMRHRLSHCRLFQLTTACRYYNLKVSGTKQEVVERLLCFAQFATREVREHLASILNYDQPSQQAGERDAAVIRVVRPWVESHAEQRSNSKSPRTPRKGDTSLSDDEVRSMLAAVDPFHPIAPIQDPFVYIAPCKAGSVTISLDLVELKSLRRQGYSVWIRSVSLNSKGKERHTWPRELRVFVNMTQVVKIEEPKRLKKRRDEPIDMSPLLQSGKNHVQISVTDANPSKFVVAIIVCAQLSDRFLVSSVSHQSTESCVERLQGILNVKSELIEDASDGTRMLDLRCPISLNKIQVPAHGTACDHIRCFDLAAFVSVNRCTSNINLRWTCPICQKTVFPKDLIVDSYVKEIVESTRPEELEVSLDLETCQWKSVASPARTEEGSSEEETEQPEVSPGAVEEAVAILDLDDDDDDTVSESDEIGKTFHLPVADTGSTLVGSSSDARNIASDGSQTATSPSSLSLEAPFSKKLRPNEIEVIELD